MTNASAYSDRGAPIRVALARGADEVVLSVKDEGIGFHPAGSDGLFQLFSRGEQAKRRAEGGLGIGLHVAKEIVEAHGGSIAASSAGRGKGAQFVIRLPAG